MTTILPILVACSATPVPNQVIEDYQSHANYASVNHLIDHNRYEVGDLIPVNRDILLPHHQRNHLVKRSPQFPIKFPLKFPIKFPKKPKKKLKLTKPVWKPALKKSLPFKKGIAVGGVVTKKKVKKTGKVLTPVIGSPLLLKTKAAAPAAVVAVPALAVKAPKAVGPVALGPLALGAKPLLGAPKLLGAGPLLAGPALLTKGPLVGLKKKAAIGLPAALLLSQNLGGGTQRSGSSGGGRSSPVGHSTGGCHGNGSSHSSNSSRGHQNDPCTREGDTHAAEEEITTRTPTEEEKEAALEAQAAIDDAQAQIDDAQAQINEAKAAMQEALAALQG